MLSTLKGSFFLLLTASQSQNFILFYCISEVYADPTHSSYEALRFVSGVTTTFTPRVRNISCSFIKVASGTSHLSCFHHILGRS